jgi:hypothetical protein
MRRVRRLRERPDAVEDARASLLGLVGRVEERARGADVGSAALRTLRTALPFRQKFRLDLLLFEWTKGRAVPLSVLDRLRMLRHGFLSSSYYLYGFGERRNYADYVSEYQKMAYTAHINGARRRLLDDKFAFHEALSSRGFGDRLPALFGALGGERTSVDDLGAADVLELLDRGEKLVLKSATGAGGAGVYVCDSTDGGYVVNGVDVSASTVRSLVDSLEGYLVTAYCEQAAYAAGIYPHAANTVRVLTMHPGDGAFVAAAVHRFGTVASGGVDNWSRGGIAGEVDRETGAIAPATRYPVDGEVRRFESHPDTGARIAGRRVPGWDRIRDGILELADAFPDVPYVGWDLLVTAPGEFVVLEGNNQPDVDLIQVNGPLLADERVVDFYDRFVDDERWPPARS